MRLKKWYALALGAWLISGLPILILGYGFSGGQLELPNLDYVGPIEVLLFATGWLFVTYPLWLAPFGIRLRGSGPREDS